MNTEPISVLLIEDDEDDYRITTRLLSSSVEPRFRLVWRDTLETGLRAVDDRIVAVLLDLSLPDSCGSARGPRASP
jgi:DNA-binding response OmpR family regulator